MRDALAELRAGDEHLGAAVLEPVAHWVRAKGGEERPHDRTELQDAVRAEVRLRQAVQEKEDTVALIHNFFFQEVCDFVALF